MSNQIIRKKNIRKKTLPKTSASKNKAASYEGSSPTNFYIHDGKKYAIGAIISVGFDPYFVKKSKKGRKKKNKSFVPETELDYVVEDEEEKEGGDWEGEYGPAKQSQFEEKEAESEEEDEGGFISKPIRKKAEWETGETFKEKEVQIFEGTALDIAKEYGLPYKKVKLVSEPHKYKVDDYEVRYRGYDKYLVAARDDPTKLYLKPYSPVNLNKINIIDGDFLPPPVPLGAYIPEKAYKPEVPEKYKGTLRVGDRVTFKYTNSVHIEGPIIGVGDEDFDVVTPLGKVYKKLKYKDVQNLRFKPVPAKMISKDVEMTVVIKNSSGKKKKWTIDTTRSTKKDNILAKTAIKKPYKYAEFELESYELLNGIILDYDEEGFVISVSTKDVAETVILPYEDPTIKLEKRRGIKETQAYRVNVAEDYLKLPVKTKTRLYATKQLFRVFSSIIPGVYESSIDTDPAIKKLGDVIDWSLANSVKKSWEIYYEEQFGQWNFSKNYQKFYTKAPSFETQAEEEYNSSIDPFLIIEGLEYVFGDIFSGNGARLLAMMNIKSEEDDFHPTIIDISIRKNLTKYDYEELEKLEGSRLATTIAFIIQDTMRTNPPLTSDQIEIRLKQEWAHSKTLDYIPTEKDKNKFDNEYLVLLTENYEKYIKDFKLQMKKKKEFYNLRKSLENEHRQRVELQSKVHRFKTISVDGKQLSSRGMLLADDVSILEEKIHVETNSEIGGKTNQNYLNKILNLIMFLDSETEIGKHTNFLKSKIASGIYKVDQTDSMTYMSMFPEFFANDKYKKATGDNNYSKVVSQIENQIELDVLDFIDIWILSNQPRIREKYIGKIVWDKYLELPNKSCGGFRLKKDLSYKGLEDSKNYDCERTVEDKYFCKAKLETIPDDDLILCYNEEIDKFTCSSINDVLYALWEQNNGEIPINPITNKPYDDDFLDRMKRRYGDLLKSREFTKRVISFTTTEDILLFGENDEEQIEIKKAKKAKKAKKTKKTKKQ